MLRSYSQNIRPRAKKFFVRSFCFEVMSSPSSARSLRVEMGTSKTVYCLSEPSLSGFDAYAALFRFCCVKASLLTMSAPPAGSSPTLVFRAAGFIATRTSGASPGVWMSVDEKLSWKPDTPGREPAGARISAGKSGSVEMSLPKTAAVRVNWLPVSCIPSPESPANRIVTRSSCCVWCSSGRSVVVIRLRAAPSVGGVVGEG